MSLPAKDDHVCVNCDKTVDWTDNSKVWCGRKRKVKEGYCCEWVGGK